jgi:hypothetical protein
MRRFIMAAALAIGLVALWAAVLPLTAEPATRSAAGAGSPALSKALFLCRGPNGIDRACAASLARALVLDASDKAPTKISDRICPVDPQVFAGIDRGD